MKRTDAIAISWLVCLLGCPSVTHLPPFGSTTAGSGAAGTDAQCVQNQLCVRGDRWDRSTCACVPDSGAAGAGGDAGTALCIETRLCVRGDHWDRATCTCVPDEAAGSGGSGAAGNGNSAGSGAAGGGAGAADDDAGVGTCIETQLCVRGRHWDRTTCACVSDSAAGSGGASGQSGAGGAAGMAFCVQNQLCVRGGHWDPMLCHCVVDGPPGETCGVDTCGANEHCCQVASAADGTCAPRCQSVCPGQPCKAPAPDAGAADSCSTARDCTGPLPHICALCAKPDGGVPSGSGCAHWACKQGQCTMALCD
jgi:hypothetical protein